ncbi:MAG TPA: GDSL-type esterase/lipase family protein [Anaerolineales bacterium]|nr:GDSL-type esterase/lipase family protein [Anaerolineales bacterium]
MFTNRLFCLSIVIAILVVAACTPQVEVTPTATSLPETNTPQVEMTATEPPSPTLTVTSEPHWNLVVVGDSIPYNSPNDCPGCTSFVDRYAEAITVATGKAVKVQNLSTHTGLQIDGLLQMLASSKMQESIANADIIIVGIAHNDAAMNSNDDLCDGPNGDNPDWSKYNAECAIASAELFQPKFESVYSQIVALRDGKPTIFRTINRYNDWNGWPGHDLSPEGIKATKEVIDAWNEMICKAAEDNGFVCADIYSEFNGSDGLTPSGDLVARDYTHPSDKGNEVIAQVLTEIGFAPLVP